jgi:hypothetical protein
MRLTSTGLGIGTSSPATKLDIAGLGTSTPAAIFRGGAGVGNSGGLGLYTSATDANARNWYVVSNSTSYGDLNIKVGTSQGADPTSGTIVATFSSAGIVTMGAYGAGAATFSASGVISSVSDETWKIKDGVPVDSDAMLNKLEPGYWYYNDDKKDIFGKDRQLGFYAQNVNAAIGPEAAPEPEENKPWGYYDRSVLAVTVMSLKKTLKTIESLTQRITELEAK